MRFANANRSKLPLALGDLRAVRESMLDDEQSNEENSSSKDT